MARARRIIGWEKGDKSSNDSQGIERWVNGKTYLFFCLLVVSFVLLFVYPARYLFPEHKTLRLFVSVETKEKGYIKVYYDDGKGFREKLSQSRILFGTYPSYEFSKRFEKTIKAIRLDPIDHKGELIIRRVDWQWLGEKKSLEGDDLLKIIKPIKYVRVELVGKYLKVIALGDDPQLLINKKFKYSWWRVFRDSYLDPRYIGLLFLLAFTLWFFWQFCMLKEDISDFPFMLDPLSVVISRKRELLIGAVFFALVANLAFYDVLWTGHTMVSIPAAHFRGEPLPKTKGCYLIDPCAGENIEAPGLWFTHDALFKNREVPFWNFYEGCGQPYLANGEVAALSLLQLPLHAKPTIPNWNRYAVFRIFLAAFFAFIWILSLRIRSISALFGAIAFGFGVVFVGYANKEHPNASLFVPLIFLFIESLLYSSAWWRFWLLSLTIGLALNGGNPQPVVATSVFVGIRLLWNIREGSKFIRNFALVLLAFFVGGALTSFTLLPLLEILTKSFSRGITGCVLLYVPWHPLKFLSPSDANGLFAAPWQDNCWVGPSAGLALYLGIIFYKFCKRGESVFTPYLVGWGVFFSLFVRLPVICRFWEYIKPKLPIYAPLEFYKYVSPFVLISAVLAAMFLDVLLDEVLKSRTLFIGIGSLTVVVSLWVLWVWTHGEQKIVTPFLVLVGFYSVFLFLLLFGLWKFRIAAMLPLILIVEMMFIYPYRPQNIYNVLPVDLPAVDFLKGKVENSPYRFCGWDTLLLPYTSSVPHVPSIMFISPLPLRNYHSLLTMMTDGASAHIRRANTISTFLSPCLSFLGVKYVLSDIHLSSSNHILLESWGGIFKEIKIVRQRDFQFIDVDPLLFRGRIDIVWKVCFVGLEKSVRDIGNALLRIDVKETKGVKVVIGNETFHRDDAGIIRVDLTPFIGKKVPFSLDSKGWSKLSLSVDLTLPSRKLDLSPTWYEGVFTIYENPQAKPIAWFPSSINFLRTWSILNTAEEICGDVIYLPEKAKGVISTLRDCDRKVLGFRYVGLNSAEIRIENSCPSWLFVTINDDGNWRALIDGEEIPVFKAQKTFMAVPIKKTGRHVLMLSYRPKAFVIGVILSLFVIIFFMIGSLGLFLRDASSKKGRFSGCSQWECPAEPEHGKYLQFENADRVKI